MNDDDLPCQWHFTLLSHDAMPSAATFISVGKPDIYICVGLADPTCSQATRCTDLSDTAQRPKMD